MPSPSKIAQLSNEIATRTRELEQYLLDNNLPLPSLDASAPPYPIPEDAPRTIKDAQSSLIESCDELRDLVTGPRELIRFSWTQWVSVKAIIRFKLDQCFGIGEQMTIEEISKRCGLNPRNTARIVRHAIINHRIFEEPSRGVITHSGLSAILNQDELVRNSLAFALDEFWPAGVRAADAMEKWPNSEEANETGFSMANNSDKGMYDIFVEHPERGEKFGLVMSNVDERRDFLLDNFPWSKMSTVVDVGGSHGSIAISIAERFPHIQCYVQDLPSVVTEGEARLPEHVRNQVHFMQHDFFQEQPVEADVYYFRSIFHNWSDKYSVQILRALIPALKPGASIVIHERILPAIDNTSKANARRALNMDIGMLQLLNSYQREERDWSALFELADSRFQYVGSYQPEGAVRWIIEGRWQG